MTFILAEDEALHTMLRGITVSDSKNPSRQVGVWFGQPDPELQNQAYPYITIDLLDITEARERVMSGRANPWYFEPEDLSEDADDWWIYNPTPINLDYQITTYARQPRHDRQILAQLMANRLPLRFGSLQCLEKSTEVDGETLLDVTVRRLDVLNVVKRDIPESGKRLFMNAFTIRVSSEIQGPYAVHEVKQARELNFTLYPFELVLPTTPTV